MCETARFEIFFPVCEPETFLVSIAKIIKLPTLCREKLRENVTRKI